MVLPLPFKILGMPIASAPLTPTPVEENPILSREIGVETWVKREDLQDKIGSGVKRRAIAATLAYRAVCGKTPVIIDGVPQSNCVRSMAHYCRHEGVALYIILRGPPPSQLEGNYRAIRESGAEIIQLADPGLFETRLTALVSDLRRKGTEPLIVPAGAAAPFAMAGPISLGYEIAEQEAALGISFDHVVLPVGTAGTIVGLILSQQFCYVNWSVVGIRIDDYDRFIYKRLFRLCAEAIGFSLPLPGRASLFHPNGDLPFTLYDGAVGDGYGRFTSGDVDESERLLSVAGLYLGPTYMLKAVRGLQQLVLSGHIGRQSRVLLVHTGGTNERASLNRGCSLASLAG